MSEIFMPVPGLIPENEIPLSAYNPLESTSSFFEDPLAPAETKFIPCGSCLHEDYCRKLGVCANVD